MKRIQPLLEAGFSLVELLVALSIATISIVAALGVFTSLTNTQYKAIQSTAGLELPQAAFDRFLSFYNHSAANAKIIENQGPGEYSVSFSGIDGDDATNIGDVLTLPLTLDQKAQPDLKFYYQVFPVTDITNCSLDASLKMGCNISDVTTSLNTAASNLFSADVAYFYVTLSNGTPCKVTNVVDDVWSVEASAYCSAAQLVSPLTIITPRMVFYTRDNSVKFSRSVMWNLATP